MKRARIRLLVILVVLAATSRRPLPAEVIDDIVAWVNGEIITLSEFREEREVKLAEAYKRLRGDELQRHVDDIQKNLLLDMIDTRILVDQARRIYDMDKMQQAFYEDFRKSQNVDTEEDFERLLAKEGMTVSEVKDRLLRWYAPGQVLRSEVKGRVAVGNAEVERYYEANPDQFVVPAEATLREIVLLADDETAKATRRSEAEEVLKRLTGGEDFAEVAREESEAGTAEQGGLLGTVHRRDLVGQLDELAFSLPPGQISGIIEMPYGYHLLKVEARTDERVKTLDEVREDLRTVLEEEHYQKQVRQYLERARGQAEWCVKPRYHDLLPLPSPSCERS